MVQNSGINNKTRSLGPKVRICQINVEGISCAKSDYMAKAFEEENIDIALIQETHTANLGNLLARGSIAGYELVAAEFSKAHGIATYVKNNTKDVKVIASETFERTYTSTISVGSLKVTNVYKAPTAN